LRIVSFVISVLVFCVRLIVTVIIHQQLSDRSVIPFGSGKKRSVNAMQRSDVDPSMAS
jgi:hypothetical protein